MKFAFCFLLFLFIFSSVYALDLPAPPQSPSVVSNASNYVNYTGHQNNVSAGFNLMKHVNKSDWILIIGGILVIIIVFLFFIIKRYLNKERRVVR